MVPPHWHWSIRKLYLIAYSGGLMLPTFPALAQGLDQPVLTSNTALIIGLLLTLLILVVGVLYYRHHKNITQLRRTKEAVEHSYILLNAVFNHSPIGMMVQDPQRRIVRSNTALASIIGIRPEMLDNLGVPLASLITDPTIRNTMQEAYDRLLTQPSHMLKIKVPIRSVNGRKKWTLVSAQTLMNGDTIFGLLWQVQDITREENALRELQHNASHDPLTSLLNRRAFMELWSREYARAMRLGSPMSLILIDLDHFKHINDHYGHQAGDEVLIHIASLLKDYTRDTDIVARFGGEEFVLLLPDTDQAGALEAGEKIRQAAADNPIPLSDNQYLKVTLSAGAAQWEPKESFESLYQKADAALYRAKQAGRNRVEMWDEHAQQHISNE